MFGRKRRMFGSVSLAFVPVPMMLFIVPCALGAEEKPDAIDELSPYELRNPETL